MQVSQLPVSSEFVWVWGLPLAPFTRAEAADAVMDLVANGGPAYFITANAHYAMLSHSIERLREINRVAAFIVADGAPLVWASRYLRTPLPERVAGSDLIYDLCERAAEKGFALYLLGGEPGVAEEAGRKLIQRYPELRIVGAEAPPFRPLSDAEQIALCDRIRAARPDLLLVAFGQPKGELWLAENLPALNGAVGVQIGASLDFVAGRVRRAPRAVQKVGMEWAYRIWTDPSRLAPRYARNAWFIVKMIANDAKRSVFRSKPRAEEVRR
jgi:N-acetylglucosaminyldiphosphoundecaprenol N-acetyl-beta-D-mannosaminyltransferase